ncbi:unnamed protein product [Mucor circinelloides]|uniref:Peptidase A1 domain-containing protein n=1 Tax=Mucor circinelloides f. circinelloides (strain 1006PhL) TaxID=1220926 RepID=S2JJ00_MUCC1|nr:hypothetical protein HMPREF1544_02821 [Mucor circinelloides 1006PhL]KAG1112421.1 hypothetical protein G6F42_014748 [Rhizopus arrhizus]
MRLSTSIIIVSAVVSTVAAYPTDFIKRGVSSALSFPCGDDVPNWVANIEIGTPDQTFPLLLDTSSKDTWVAGIMCKSEFCLTRKGPLFDAGKSSTIQNEHTELTLEYEQGTVVGDLYQDNLKIGGTLVKDYPFVKAFGVAGFNNSVTYAGILGLGGSEINKAKRALLLDKRGPSSSIGEPSTFYGASGISYKRKRNNVGEKTCQFAFGIDESRIEGDIAWFDLPTCDYGSTPFWKAKLTCAKIEDVADLKFKKTVASFDTSVKDIQIPHKDLAVIHEGLKAEFNAHSNQYEFKCCYAKDLKFSFEKYDVTLPSEAWTKKVNDEICTDIFQVLEPTKFDHENTWKLGTKFITNFVSIFDEHRRQTGLALLANGNNKGLTITAK